MTIHFQISLHIPEWLFVCMNRSKRIKFFPESISLVNPHRLYIDDFDNKSIFIQFGSCDSGVRLEM
jgi:hypothetical protein